MAKANLQVTAATKQFDGSVKRAVQRLKLIAHDKSMAKNLRTEQMQEIVLKIVKDRYPRTTRSQKNRQFPAVADGSTKPAPRYGFHIADQFEAKVVNFGGGKGGFIIKNKHENHPEVGPAMRSIEFGRSAFSYKVGEQTQRFLRKGARKKSYLYEGATVKHKARQPHEHRLAKIRDEAFEAVSLRVDAKNYTRRLQRSWSKRQAELNNLMDSPFLNL